MQITITLSDKEVQFLQRMIDEDKQLENRTTTFDEVIHECITMATFDEGETTAQEEGM